MPSKLYKVANSYINKLSQINKEVDLESDRKQVYNDSRGLADLVGRKFEKVNAKLGEYLIDTNTNNIVSISNPMMGYNNYGIIINIRPSSKILNILNNPNQQIVPLKAYYDWQEAVNFAKKELQEYIPLVSKHFGRYISFSETKLPPIKPTEKIS